MQNELMKFDPATGEDRPYPSHAEQWRKYHGKLAWLFNPWTGDRRSAQDVGSDVYGYLISPPSASITINEQAEQHAQRVLEQAGIVV